MDVDVSTRDKHIYRYEDFLSAHKAQLLSASVPERFWIPLFEKLTKEVFDAGEHFQVINDEGNYEVVATSQIDHKIGNNIFLVDHAWTFRPADARNELENIPGLLERMIKLFGMLEKKPKSDEVKDVALIDDSDTDDEVVYEDEKKARITEVADEKQIDGVLPRQVSVDAYLCQAANDDQEVNKVLRDMWLYAQTYSIRTKSQMTEGETPVWYIIDEFGSFIGHSDVPNFRLIPFYFAPTSEAFSLLFPVAAVMEGDSVRRDYVDTTVLQQHPDWRAFLLHPWQEGEFSEVLPRMEPPKDFFISGRKLDDLPSRDAQNLCVSQLEPGKKMAIYTDSPQLLNNLQKHRFSLVDDWRQADVLWLSTHFHEYRELCAENPRALVNQFPYESCLTVKDLLAAILHPEMGMPEWEWFETCFNLTTELPQFCKYFQEREQRNEDNIWIIKPWNLARGLDMHISGDLKHIIRLIESGPKIACKYITNPVLFRRPDNGAMVKFDLRFIVFVDRFRWNSAWIYKNFWIRFAINQFDLTQLDNPETHFTVFNYGDEEKVLQVFLFIVLTRCWKLLPRSPLVESPRTSKDRTRSNCDVSILECNFMPDCERACAYYSDFADTVFDTLFMGHIDESKVAKL
ncbi:unnamed protein product, partial [Mesorhabditis spiculigera]